MTDDITIIISSAILAIGTIALVGVTLYYALQTKKLRQIGELPSFALKPEGVNKEGHVFSIFLLNTGQTATDIRVDCEWSPIPKNKESETTTKNNKEPENKKRLYIISLSKDGYVFLPEVPITEINKNEGKLTLTISCKDYGGNECQVRNLEADFSKITKEGRRLVFQQKPTEPQEDWTNP